MRRITAALAITALAISLAGCNSNNKPEATSSPTATPTVSETPTPDTPEEHAKIDAQQALVRYFEVVDELGQQPEIPLRRLKQVAISSDLTLLTNRFKQYRAKGWVTQGDSRYVVQNVEDVSLDNSDPKGGRVPYVLVSVCEDVKSVDVVDKSGKSVTSPDRSDAYVTKYTVANYDWKKDPQHGWKVASRELVKEAEACDG